MSAGSTSCRSITVRRRTSEDRSTSRNVQPQIQIKDIAEDV
jgi:hypothetical protein